MMSEEKSDFKQFEVTVRIEASNTFRVQAATRKRAEEIALDTARERDLIEAIKQGEAPQALIAALKDEEARKGGLLSELNRLASLRQSSSLDLKRIEKTIRKRVEDVQKVLGRHIPESRRILKNLLVGRMEFTPIIEANTRGYAFKGRASLDGLLAGTAPTTKDGSPNGNTTFLEDVYFYEYEGVLQVAVA